MEEKILNFIKHFSNFGPEVEDCFLHGNCYWFAAILQKRFKAEHPYLVYAEIDNHFGCSIHGEVYDISGNVTNSYNWVDWDAFQFRDHKLAERLFKDCINFENDPS